MKTSSGPESPDLSARQRAQGCFTANLAVPGLGSLMGGRKAGYVQMALCLSGLAISTICGFRFISWSLAHWSEYHNPDADPLFALRDLWNHARWPLLGISLFAIAWGWALLTSWVLLAQAGKTAAGESMPHEKS